MRVLLTGGSGFIGKHCLAYLLENGHTVVTTVRSAAKGRECLEKYPKSLNTLSYIIVEDIRRSGAFDEAVQSQPFDAVVHTASPFHYHAADLKLDMIDPAIMGTMEILGSIKNYAPSVKRVVITSSFAAVVNFQEEVPFYTSDCWNPITMEQSLTNGQLAYVGSKKFAEKAAWDFMHNENPAFTLSTINPVLVFGPTISRLNSLADVNTSNAIFRDFIDGKLKSGIPPNEFQWVDVRDVALAHIRAIEVPAAAGKRFLAAAGPYNNHQIAAIIKKNFPMLADNLPEQTSVADGPPRFVIDNDPMKRILGISFRSFEDCVIDTVKALLEVNS
ncbi:SDR family oxidoreductase [Aspergillus aculeatinus CBS 121060]|uniref:Dihydroflavonol-4-reductase n=1 Tax=Aspergillus aculeatinus CBS 121060 TaxID=1448322 RepID=A0ACD1HQ64_9EURO|nr:dihydroflavonol-4-reductase [Aspergillus aculeatinus CBS 121060]RAH75726.1 dihydroflavonol-4-reductase [Aspergillus aculeatinus CBS 121060]